MATTTEDKPSTAEERDELAIRRANAIPDTELSEPGKSIDDMALDEDDVTPEKPLPPMRQTLPGTSAAISSSFGGTRPTESEIRLLGGKMPIAGSFAKGEEILLMVKVRVGGVLGQDVMDEWGASSRTVRRHMARMIEVRRLTPASGGGYELTDQQEIPGV